MPPKLKQCGLASGKTDVPDTPFNISWPVDPICALGVFFYYDATKAAKLDFDEKLRSMEKILNIKKNRKC